MNKLKLASKIFFSLAVGIEAMSNFSKLFGVKNIFLLLISGGFGFLGFWTVMKWTFSNPPNKKD